MTPLVLAERMAGRLPRRLWVAFALGLLAVGTAVLVASDVRLDLFYENGLAHSVFPPVLVGVAFMTLFAELFGWTFSGLLVPGYLAPILVLEPWSAVVIAVEAALTYAFVAGLSSVGARLGLWSEFFGRERFLAILVGSVGVRLVVEGWLVDAIGGAASHYLSTSFDAKHTLFSIGFVVVPLLANLFWATGLRRALLPVAITVACTYLVTSYVLINHTNFSVGHLNLLYEGAAINFTASPKAHIVLLTGAALASYANLRYGWDFNGILVPALLALIWPTPTKLVTTVAEALVIFAAARFIVSRRQFETTTIEGPRMILLLFSLSFLTKALIDAVVGRSWPGLTAIDFYGFGYLLPTLIAAKMWQLGKVSSVLVPTLRTSLAAAVVGNLVGFGLTFVPVGSAAAPTASRADLVEGKRDAVYATALLSLSRLRRASASEPADRVGPEAFERFSAAVAALAAALAAARPDAVEGELTRIAALAAGAGYETVVFRDAGSRPTDVLLRERWTGGAPHGWGIYLFSARPGPDLRVEVPYPVRERDAFESGLALYGRLGARALFVSGEYPRDDAPLDEETTDGPLMAEARRAFADAPVLEVRAGDVPAARLEVRYRLTASLDLNALRAAIGEVRLDFGADPARGDRAASADAGFASLTIPTERAAMLVAREFAGGTPPVERARARLADWFQQNAPPPASGSVAPVAASAEELAFLDQQLLTPLFAAAPRGLSPAELDRLGAMAALVGYRAVVVADPASLGSYVVLAERVPRTRFWGTFAVRTGDAAPLLIEALRPGSELEATPLAFRLADRLEPRALLVPGATSRDPNGPEAAGPGSVFEMAHERAQAASAGPNGAAPLALQVRGSALRAEDVGGDAVLSTGTEVADSGQLPAAQRRVADTLAASGYRVALFDGSLARAPFAAGDNAQRTFSDHYFPGSFASVWLTKRGGAPAPGPTEAAAMARHAGALGIECAATPLAAWLDGRALAPDARDVGELEPVAASVRRYGELLNIHDLAAGVARARALGFAPVLVTDPAAGPSFLALTRAGGVAEVFRVDGGADGRLDVSAAEPAGGAIASFAGDRTLWLRVVP